MAEGARGMIQTIIPMPMPIPISSSAGGGDPISMIILIVSAFYLGAAVLLFLFDLIENDGPQNPNTIGRLFLSPPYIAIVVLYKIVTYKVTK
jgi:hypothetical protein